MKKIGIFYGSSTGTTSELAQKIAKAVGAEANCFDVANASAEDAASFDVLLLGSSTWGIGDLQDDWESFLPELASQNLSGKAVALLVAVTQIAIQTLSAKLLLRLRKVLLVQVVSLLVLMLQKNILTMLLLVKKMVSLSVYA